MMERRILVAGIGNIFFGDDAFGVEVIRRLLQQPLAEGVRAIDFGIRGFDLGTAILDGYEAVILVDAIARGGRPGTLSVIEPDLESLAATEFSSAVDGHTLDGHTLNPTRVLNWVQTLGGRVPPLRLVGCEPAEFGSAEDPQMGLSPPVAEAVGRALPLIQSLIDDFIAERAVGACP